MTNNPSQTQTSKPPALSMEMLREKEKILWEEVRGIREITLKLLQWSVTALASLETALFFLRKDIYERMIAAKQLGAGEYVPWDKHLRGTMFLLVVALIFSAMIFLAVGRQRKMRAQLVELNLYQIDYGQPRWWGRPLMLLVPLAFPIMDVVLHISFR
jgi:hypothetical protein